MDGPSDLAGLLDPGALAIVVAGTLVATAARCGWRDCHAALAALPRLGGSRFDEGANRIAIARTLRAIEAQGFRAADVPLPPDPSLARLVAAYLASGSTEALHCARRAERASREVARMQAVRVFEYAGELAPVFGLVGTLYAIAGLADTLGGSPVETVMAGIATAVLSSLYGVLTAHLACVPLARAIERRGMREEGAREALVEWFLAHIESARIESARIERARTGAAGFGHGRVRTFQ
ncbi:MotA/TolQ/ExbB proton channel family protein [Erythrobacter sp. HL-111]|uniref:MotA/TolQ/ExbB proton channel family protein n=1 Tax=Erythrobacter sp. HL-111 TaxID=1798193 RepID=UPI0006D94F04|nr:MotA/TolQ/ExbB proton channel family protein [Erythrobacter sp. HL-111]KPP92560.1 MAG: chemotaxis protein MotA [Erythrobacteraceae bacterium HL-111]SDS91993.1 chemotaxis protein MotA [Erythrobacter sp. HL-111]